MVDGDPNVLPFPRLAGDGSNPPPRGTRTLAALIIIMQGVVKIAQIAAVVGLFLLAAIGALSLLGR